MELSNFTIGMLFIALIVGVFALAIGDVGSSSTQALDNLSNESLTSFDKLDDIVELSDNASRNFNSSEEANIFDLIGFYFNKGYSSVKVFTGSVNVFSSLSSEFSDRVKLPSIFPLVFGAIVTITLLWLLIGAVMKWRM